MAGSRIFISYRRGDASAHAGRLADRLAAEFGEERVFMDVDTIEPGADFVDYISEAVGECDVLIALIGSEWLESRDETGTRRLDDPEDFVRLEVSAGLDRDIRVVPVLVEGALMPRAHELPDPLQRLARRNALEISDSRWRHDAGRLVETVHRVLDGKPTEEAVAEAAGERVETPAPQAPMAGPVPQAPTAGPAPPPPWAPPPPAGVAAGPSVGGRDGAAWRRPVIVVAALGLLLLGAGVFAVGAAVLSGGEEPAEPPPGDQLRSHIPAAIASKCDPIDPKSNDLVSDGALAVFACRPSSRVLLDYYLFPSTTATVAEYREQMNELEPGGCLEAWNVEGGWDLEEQPAGKWKCYDAKGTSVMEWTHDRLRIYTLMSSKSDDRRGMRRIWKVAGPE